MNHNLFKQLDSEKKKKAVADKKDDKPEAKTPGKLGGVGGVGGFGGGLGDKPPASWRYAIITL